MGGQVQSTGPAMPEELRRPGRRGCSLGHGITGRDWASLEQLLNGLLFLRWRIVTRTTTGSTHAGSTTNWALRCVRSEVDVDAGGVAATASTVAGEDPFGAIGTAGGALVNKQDYKGTADSVDALCHLHQQVRKRFRADIPHTVEGIIGIPHDKIRYKQNSGEKDEARYASDPMAKWIHENQ